MINYIHWFFWHFEKVCSMFVYYVYVHIGNASDEGKQG